MNGTDPSIGGPGTDAGPDMLVFVSIAAGLGGSTRSLATVLSNLGPRVTRVLAAPASGKFPDIVRELGLAEHTIPIPRPGDQRLRRASRPLAAYRIARWTWRHRRRVKAIHVNGLQEVSLAVPAAVLTGVPLVMWIHDFEVYPWTRRLGPLWRRLLRRNRVRWTAVSPTARRMIVEAGLAGEGEVSLLPNPIDPADVRAETHEPSDRPVVGFVGSAERRKGFHLLPEVDRELSDLPLSWMLFTGQSAGREEDTWAKLRALPESRISFPGRVRDIRIAYARCDIIFCPSLKESFCRVAAEAMLNGVPVVASDLEPLRDLLGEEEAGLLFAPDDAIAGAKALRRVLTDPELGGTLGARGRLRAREFEPRKIVERLLSLYVVDSAPPRAELADGR